MKALEVSHPKSGTWEAMETRGDAPTGRFNAAVDVIGRHMFVFGGTRGGGRREHFDDLHVLDLKTGVWTAADVTGRGPSPRQLVASAVVGTQIYYVGGFDSRSMTRFDDLYVLDTVAMEWLKPPTSGDVPSPRSGATAVFYLGELYVLFGTDEAGLTLNDMYSLDLETYTWTLHNHNGYDPFAEEAERLIDAGASLADVVAARSLNANPIPTSRTEASAVVIDDALYVFGGFSGRGQYLADMRYLRNGTWKQPFFYGPYTAGVRNHSMALLSGCLLYVFGGENLGATFSPNNNVFVFNTETHTRWLMSSDGNVPHPRTGAGAIAYNDALYVFGGYAKRASADVYVFRPQAPDVGASH